MLRYTTDRTWFSRLLLHLARKLSRSILTTLKSAHGSNFSSLNATKCFDRRVTWNCVTLATNMYAILKENHSVQKTFLHKSDIRVANFQSSSNSLTFPDISSYVYLAVQTVRIIIDTNRNTHAQLTQQCLSTYWKEPHIM